jgi:glyoxylase-like metal-dependent hydrolase (beta-lactamase superfamily II)
VKYSLNVTELISHSSPSTRPLEFPFPVTPNSMDGDTVEVAKGVHWIRMHLPFTLDHINVWAIQGKEDVTIVDTGLSTKDNLNGWERIFRDTLQSQPVKRLICTHMHPDHIGMSGWITQRFRCPLWMTQAEYLMCRLLAAEANRPPTPDALRFYVSADWQHSALDHYRARFGHIQTMTDNVPGSYYRISDGDAIGAHRWCAIVGKGHSPEHLCLYCPDLRLLIAGDQVLPKITSNVSVYPSEPEADPLGEWLESLRKIRKIVPDDVLVLPAHNEPFFGLHRRINEIIRGHDAYSTDRERGFHAIVNTAVG